MGKVKEQDIVVLVLLVVAVAILALGIQIGRATAPLCPDAVTVFHAR